MAKQITVSVEENADGWNVLVGKITFSFYGPKESLMELIAVLLLNVVNEEEER